MKKDYTIEEIKRRVTTDWLWAERGLIALYKRQTADEQANETTKYKNRIGFNVFDAGLFTYCAKWLKVSPYRHLNEKFSEKIMSRIGKYAGQLKEIAGEA